MQFSEPLVRGRLLRRYKRFLADVALDAGGEVTAHCPNPGAMLGLAEPGMAVWLEPTPGPRRKLSHAWRLVELDDGHMAGIDTGVPNKVVAEALATGSIAEVAGGGPARPEVAYGTGSRVDFLLPDKTGRPVYLEVKNVHLRRDGDWAEFPDCVTARGAKHLRELSAMVAAGHRALMLYVIQRTDCARFRLAGDLDPAYARAFAEARTAGVEAAAYGTEISPGGVRLAGPLPLSG